jgi:hypothetical protein
LSKPKSIIRDQDFLRASTSTVFASAGLPPVVTCCGGKPAVSRFGAALHAFLEAAHGRAEVGADVLQLLGAEDQHHHRQNDQPMPHTERTHHVSPRLPLAARRATTNPSFYGAQKSPC